MGRRRKMQVPAHVGMYAYASSVKRDITAESQVGSLVEYPRFAAPWLAVVLLASTVPTGSCRALPDYRSTSGHAAGATTLPPSLEFSSITAVPTKRSIYRELNRLGAMRSEPAARLRVAFLLAQIARADEAMTELNSLLFGGVDHGPTIESFARYLRAEAFARRGDADQADADRRIALSRAMDPTLRAKLEPLVRAADAAALAEASSFGKLEIRPRSSWRARRATAMDPMGRVFRATVHHSAMLARDRSERAAIASILAIQRNHQELNGWSDLGYHYLIDTAGRIWEGRESRWQGAHAGGPKRNRGNVGICLLGNFVDGGQHPSAEQKAALLATIRWLQRRHGFDNQAILTHGELKVTDCPGRNLQVIVDQLRARPPDATRGR